jgi:hypothetical protein
MEQSIITTKTVSLSHTANPEIRILLIGLYEYFEEQQNVRSASTAMSLLKSHWRLQVMA